MGRFNNFEKEITTRYKRLCIRFCTYFVLRHAKWGTILASFVQSLNDGSHEGTDVIHD